MSDLLNPLHPTNPNQQIQEANKKTTKTKDYFENTGMIPLPSKGVFYIGDYKNLETLKVRPLDYTDEDILTTESYFTSGKLFDELLANVIIDENGFDAKSLVPIDRDTILIWLRATAFGKDFIVEYKCPECGAKDELKWDLSALEFPEYSEEVFKQLSEEGCVMITTPLTDTKVKISVPSIATSNSISKSYAEKKKNEKSSRDFYATGTLLSVVQGVMIDEEKQEWTYSRMNIDAYFRKIKLPLADSRYILKESGKLNLKYDTQKVHICKNKECNHITEGVELPMLHKNFFWPEL